MSRSDHPLQTYLAEIARTPLLTADEERQLFRRLDEGRRADVSLGSECIRARHGMRARDHILRANLRFAVMIARLHVGKGMALEDLIQEGNRGLIRAVEKFQLARGVRFTTYAAYWIKQFIGRSISDKARLVRLPNYMQRLMSECRKKARALSAELGREPTSEEVAAALPLPAIRAWSLQMALRLSVCNVQSEPTEDDDSHDSLRLIPERRAQDPDAGLQMEEVAAAMKCLNERELALLRMRFGFDGKPMTLKAVGEAFGLTRERVRQIQFDALAKLRKRLGVETLPAPCWPA